MESQWIDIRRPRPEYAMVRFNLSFAMKDPAKSRLLGMMFSTMADKTIEAFEKRCEEKYGLFSVDDNEDD